jgi:hypothetical protein
MCDTKTQKRRIGIMINTKGTRQKRDLQKREEVRKKMIELRRKKRERELKIERSRNTKRMREIRIKGKKLQRKDGNNKRKTNRGET